MKLGRPEDFHGNIEVRLLSIERAIAQYQFSAEQIKSRLDAKVDEHTTFFLKGLGNEVNFLSTFRELFFNSRELLDNLLWQINKKTEEHGVQTNKRVLTFAKKLMLGEYDKRGLRILSFLKGNITYIFHIRKIRNEIKNQPANINFRFVTDHFEAYFWIPIMKDEMELIQYLDIKNKDEAIAKMAYHCTYNLDELFPEMLRFWKTGFSILETDFSS